MTSRTSRLRHSVVLLFALLFAAALWAQRPTVILVSIDGFRADYLDTLPVPVLRAIAASGVRAEAMTPVFPSKTFPNHYSIATGLYTEHHGIVGNTFYDPEFKATFRIRDQKELENPRWWGGEPIWVTAERQGVKCGTIYWPGSTVAIKGVRPSYWEPYIIPQSYAARVNEALGWLDLPADKRPSLVTLYFESVDAMGHRYGPGSPEVADAAAKVDAALARLREGLKKRGLEDSTDLIVVSDHGMTSISPGRVVFLDDYVDLSELHIVDWSPVLQVEAKNGDNAALLRQLKNVPHLASYLSAETPARWHYRDNRRITPIVGLVDEGWTLDSHAHFAKMRDFDGGNHGFDNELPSMRALFIATGPDFKAGSRLKVFPNVDVYELLAHLLKIVPAPNDGTLEVFRTVLKK
jgi:predicted AlkP superfamily pyrophosphatase or phosphodiesterase